jgi:hypothetical protein
MTSARRVIETFAARDLKGKLVEIDKKYRDKELSPDWVCSRS